MSLYSSNQNISSNPLSIDGLITNDFDVLTVNGVGLVPYTGASQAVDLNNKSISNVSSLAVNGTISGSTITSSGTVSGTTISGTTITASGTVSGSTISGTSINGTNITASSALSGNTSAITFTETIGRSLMVGTYYNVPSIQVTASNQILVSVPSIPTSWIAGDQVKIVAFNQTVFNTTMTILSVTGSGFYSSFISGLANGTYTSPTAYVYNYNNISIGTISGINVTAINTISANFLNAFLGAQIASLACTGTTSTQTLTSTVLFTASGGGINTNTLYATGLITAGAGISSFTNLYCNGAMIVNGTSNPANGVSAVWTRFESVAIGGTITCGTFGTGYLPLSINSSVLDFTINGTSKITLEASGNLNAKTSITTPNTSTGIFQSYSNGWSTSSVTAILSGATDWIGSSYGNFASITNASGNRTDGLGVGIDSTGNTWMISLKPSVDWRAFNQVASSYTYYTNTRVATDPVLAIDAYGKTTIRNSLVVRGNSSVGSTANYAPNLLCYVSSDSYAYPAFSTFSHDHNNIALMFDMIYVVGTGWVTGYNSINWMMYKYNDTISFQYVPATTAGSTVTPVTTLQLTSTATIIQSNPLKLKGPANQYSLSTTGPNIHFYTDSDAYAYPTMTSFNYNHDNFGWMFDMYYDVGLFKSCYNTVNWFLRKNAGCLFFQYIDAVPAGTSSTLKNMMVVTNTGVVISPTSGSYSAPNVLHLIKDVSVIGDTSLMITWENTVGGYYDFLCGYYRVPNGTGCWVVRGGTPSYTTAIPLMTVYPDGKVGVNGVEAPQYALDCGTGGVGASAMTSTTTLTLTAGTSASNFTVYNGGDESMILNQSSYHNIAQKQGLTSIAVGTSWYFGTLFTQDSFPGATTRALNIGYSNPLDSGNIICLAPAVAWKDLRIASNVTYFYEPSLAGYVNAGGFVNVSDEREKQDIKPLKTTRSLQRVLACKPMTYKRKYSCKEDEVDIVSQELKDKQYIGLLAQQACESNPHCISTWENDDKEERLGIQYNDYVVHLIGSVQELHKESLAWRAVSTEQQKQIKEQADQITLLSNHLTEMTLQINKLTAKLFSQDNVNGK